MEALICQEIARPDQAVICRRSIPTFQTSSKVLRVPRALRPVLSLIS
jgi:hypothetical protein